MDGWDKVDGCNALKKILVRKLERMEIGDGGGDVEVDFEKGLACVY